MHILYILPSMNPIPKLLSKTKLLRGYRCQKCIYLTIHQPKLEAPITPETQALFDQGNLVGSEARKYYPGGTLVDNKPWDFGGALAKTRELIASGTPVIYEAAFEYQGCYARADIIQYNPASGRWRILEVKSSTKVKPEHFDDVGLQAWIMAKSGLLIEQICIVHLNSECRYPDLSNLFNEVDVTQEIRDRYLNIQPKVYEIFQTLRQPEIPNTDLGPYCFEPTECGFVEHCLKQKEIPELSIFNLPGIKQRKWELYYQGILSLDDNRLDDLTTLQARVVDCFKTGKRFVDTAHIQQAVSQWQFPLIFLDFETINPAIPRYDGCKPFQHTPFQFSVHVWENPDVEIYHTEFLHTSIDDPRPTLIPALLKACQSIGSIVAYFGRFESERIQELAAYSPEHSAALLALTERIVDPLPIIRDAVYDNAFNGSFSLKKVAPALLGENHSYKDMDVADGGAAQRAFEKMILPSASLNEKDQLEKALLEYCKKDTQVMVELVKWIYQQTMQPQN